MVKLFQQENRLIGQKVGVNMIHAGPNYLDGILTAVFGAMFAGKTEELIAMIRRAKYAGFERIVFKHAIDNRYTADGSVITHAGDSYPAHAVSSVNDIAQLVEETLQTVSAGKLLVVVDEAQFFDEQDREGYLLVHLCLDLVNKGISVVVGGLDLDFRGEPFGPMADLIVRAHKKVPLYPFCDVEGCRNYSTRTQRLTSAGEPASWYSPTVVVAAGEDTPSADKQFNYGTRCHKHHVVPDRPERSLL